MPRIRSIKPGYNKSLDIIQLDPLCRYHFALLWTYADDEGRGLDVPALIRGELWPLDDTIDDAQIEAWQDELAAHDRIVRYTAEGRDYFQIVDFQKHQKPQKPQVSKYPALDTGAVRERSAGGKGAASPVVVVGEVEGEGEKDSCAADAALVLVPAPVTVDMFDTWWDLYPRKRAKADARKAWNTCTKSTDPQTIIDGLRAQLPDLQRQPPKFIPYPATWLRAGQWADEPDRTQPSAPEAWSVLERLAQS